MDEPEVKLSICVKLVRSLPQPACSQMKATATRAIQGLAPDREPLYLRRPVSFARSEMISSPRLEFQKNLTS